MQKEHSLCLFFYEIYLGGILVEGYVTEEEKEDVLSWKASFYFP